MKCSQWVLKIRLSQQLWRLGNSNVKFTLTHRNSIHLIFNIFFKPIQDKKFSTNLFFSEELVILKCLIYKNSNALKSFKFFKSLKYCLRHFESVNLIRRDNRTDKSTVRLEPDAIKKLGKVEYLFAYES